MAKTFKVLAILRGDRASGVGARHAAPLTRAVVARVADMARASAHLHWLSSTLTVALLVFVTARSGLVSPLKSPTATPRGLVPTV